MDAIHIELFLKTNVLQLENTKQKYTDCFTKEPNPKFEENLNLRKNFLNLNFMKLN